MKKRSVIILIFLVASLLAATLLEASRRSWHVHARLNMLSHGHVFYRVVHTSDLDGPIPSHYPVHTLESQRLAYSGNQYLGYINKQGFFVPVGQGSDLAFHCQAYFVVFILLAEGIFILISIILIIALLTINHRKTAQTKS